MRFILRPHAIFALFYRAYKKWLPPSRHMHPEQRRIFRSLTPEKKLDIALRLYYSARDMKAAGLRMQNPDWTEEKIQTKVREIFLYART